MDVRSLTSTPLAATAGSHGDYTRLNALKGSSNLAQRWGDALNRAIDDRAASADGASINGAMRTFAQFAERNTNLNTRLRDDRKAADLFEASKPKSQEKLSPADQKLEQTSQTLVNQFFMGTMLKQMRDSPFKSDLFSGGKGGEAFAGMFDSHLSEHAGNKMARGLVQAMVKAYRKHQSVGDEDSGLAPKPVARVETQA